MSGALGACGDPGAEPVPHSGSASTDRRDADAERAALEAAERYVSSGDPESARAIVMRLLERGESAAALDILARCEILRAEDAADDAAAATARSCGSAGNEVRSA